MQRFPAQFLLACGLLVGLVSFNACQKEGIQSKALQEVTPTSSDRSPEHFTYGVTVFSPGHPSEIVEIDEATGLVTNQFQAFVDPGTGPILLDDLKGICRTSWGQFFITTGNNNSNPLYNNNLLKVNVNPAWAPVGQTSFFNSVHVTPVSDLEFNPLTQTFFGLDNNSNGIIEITVDPLTGNYTQYSPVAAILGIPGRRLSGLSLVRDGNGMYLVGAASRPLSGGLSAQLYTIPAGGGLAGLITDLDPFIEFAGGHCGLGFDIDLNHLAVNRTNIAVAVTPGLSEINPWFAGLPPVTTATPWGFQNLMFEDLSTWVGM